MRALRGRKPEAGKPGRDGQEAALSRRPGTTAVRFRLHPAGLSGGAALTLLLVLAGGVRAATPPPFVLDQPARASFLTVYSDYLRDPEQQLSLRDVRRPATAQRFTPAARRIQRLGFSDDAWWIRFALHNPGEEPRQRLLSLTTGPVSSVSFYTPTDNNHQLQPSEPLRHDRLLPHNQRLYALTLPPDQTRVYYLRIIPDHGFHYSLALKPATAQLTGSVQSAAWFWAITGLLSALVLYHLGLLLLTRRPVLLAYGLFFALVVLVVASHSGMLLDPSLLENGRQAHLDALLILAGLAANVWLGQLYLRAHTELPRLNRILRHLVPALALAAPASWLLPPLVALGAAYALAGLVAVGLLWLAIYAWQQRVAEAPLYVIARAPMTLITALVLIALQGGYALQFNFPLAVLGAAFVEALLLALGLNRSREATLRENFELRQQQSLDEAIRTVRHDTLARVSHEVRTPMSGIMGMAEILEETPLTPNQREYVQAIQTAGTNLLRVVGDVLMFSGEADQPPQMKHDDFELTPGVMEAMDLFRERAEEKDIELIPHIHANVPGRVHGDSGRLRQVLINLLACAARHGYPGELVIDVARDPSGRSGHLRFELSGSALRDTDAAWRTLHTGEAVSDPGDSTALGLSIARQLVESMGGQLQLQQDRQLRPLCRFSLPLPDAEETAPVAGDEVLTGYSLLVVDDSPTVTRVIRQQALSWGMRVTVSHDPREALATLRTHSHIQDPFDVALIDQQMPGMDGLQLARRIREDPAGEQLALVMLSGVQTAPSAGAAQELGLHEILAKPLSGARLYQSLAGALGLQVGSSAPRTEPTTDTAPELHILVAEDDPLSQQVLEGMLGKLGMIPHVVDNGRQAVAAVQQQDFDLILMDCEMPEMDGFEAARRIRSLEAEQQTAPVPIIALTAHILSEHRERSQAADMNAHVPKPVELAVLREVINRFAGDGGARPRGSSPASGETPG